MILEIDGIPVEIIRKPIKSMNLRIYPPDGRVSVSVPMRYSIHLINQHLQEKSAWIRTRRELIQNRTFPKEEILQTGTTIPFLGKSYLLFIEEYNGPSQIKIKNELIYCYSQPNATQEQKQMLLDRWYRQQMASVIPELLKHWETKTGVKATEWGIKKMKTRWGSCNARAKRIWLNLNLIKKPLICLEYVLVHELVHLLEASHNQRFYALMTQFMPQWREYQEILEPKSRRRTGATNLKNLDTM